jgi:phospholipase/carboxylesterase
MWLSDGVPLAHPEGIVSGREFAHIHPDGSLHAPLPYERALEAAEKGWAERHPWADRQDGWEGLVMLFTPQSMTELDVTFQLIVESYNHVTGRTVQASDFQAGASAADDG